MRSSRLRCPADHVLERDSANEKIIEMFCGQDWLTGRINWIDFEWIFFFDFFVVNPSSFVNSVATCMMTVE